MAKAILSTIFLIFLFLPGLSHAANAPDVQNVDVLGGSIESGKIPIYISGDTIDTLTAITNTPCVIVEIYWYGPTTLGHLMAIKNAAGDMLWPMKCAEIDQGMHSGKIRLPAPTGFSMDDLDSGSVLIIIETN